MLQLQLQLKNYSLGTQLHFQGATLESAAPGAMPAAMPAADRDGDGVGTRCRPRVPHAACHMREPCRGVTRNLYGVLPIVTKNIGRAACACAHIMIAVITSLRRAPHTSKHTRDQCSAKGALEGGLWALLRSLGHTHTEAHRGHGLRPCRCT